ncbi:hypothetical protein CRUP_038108 [Coryphaenoides rupestris]|nr:hypothetical protein CRUP_038108 [Coryphaenoides rupestris]
MVYKIPGAAMDRVSLLWRLRRRARRGAFCMGFFCVSMALLYALCAENSVPVTDAIFGVRARTRAQPRTHSVIKKLPGVVPGNPNQPIPVLSSPNHTQQVKEPASKKRTRARESGFFAWLLPRPFRRVLENLFGGRRRGELSGSVGDTEFFRAHSGMGDVWDEEMSSTMLGSRLRNVAMNKYGVENKGPGGVASRPKLSGPELLCRLKSRVQVMTLTPDLQPFASLSWSSQLPVKPVTSEHGPYKQFNAAPTSGYEKDVGSKTTFRLINSQVMASDDHRFLSSSLYSTGVLVGWDPAPFSANLSQWYNRTDYPIFAQYQRYRRLHPLQPFYILHPRFEWQLWQQIQDNMAEPIQKNPPSSGLLGTCIIYTLPSYLHGRLMIVAVQKRRAQCSEFLPSRRKTELCHYYSASTTQRAHSAPTTHCSTRRTW